MVSLRINETFTSLQGEGHLAGKVTHFIRFGGCSVVQCGMHPASVAKWGECDTAWQAHDERDVEVLADEALAAVGRGGWVCVTGGEPLDQLHGLRVLVAELRRRELFLSIQTSGTQPVVVRWDWLCVSPKGAIRQPFGNELKVVYWNQKDEELEAMFRATRFWSYYLMPRWGLLPTADVRGPNTADTIAAVMRLNRRGQPWELTTQAHKTWGLR